jgi:hypothetical protein
MLIGNLWKHLKSPNCTFLTQLISFFYCFIIDMCIQGLGLFSPLPPPPPLPPTPPTQYAAETILPLFLILLKREYKQ